MAASALGGAAGASIASGGFGLAGILGAGGGLLGTMLGGPVGGAIGSTVGGLTAGAIGAVGSLANTAISMGLGTSLESFIMGSGSKWLETDKVLTQLGRRFDETGKKAGTFGLTLGYNRQETAGLLNEYGKLRDTIDRGEFQELLGFGRTFGIDPRQSIAVGTAFGTLQNRRLTSGQFAGLGGMAMRAGMGGARLGEYMTNVLALGEEAQLRTGANIDPLAAASLANLPGLGFGFGTSQAQGAVGRSMISQLDAAMTGSTAMQVYLLRQMGYGQPGGPSRTEAFKQIQAGVFDPRNVQLMFGGMIGEGLGTAAMENRLMGMGVQAYQAEAMVRALGSREQLDAYGKLSTGAAQEFLQARLSEAERAQYQREGFSQTGQGAVSVGERRQVAIENIQLDIGEDVAAFMVTSTKVLQDLWNAMKGGADGTKPTGGGAAQDVKDAVDYTKLIYEWLTSHEPSVESLGLMLNDPTRIRFDQGGGGSDPVTEAVYQLMVALGISNPGWQGNQATQDSSAAGTEP